MPATSPQRCSVSPALDTGVKERLGDLGGVVEHQEMARIGQDVNRAVGPQPGKVPPLGAECRICGSPDRKAWNVAGGQTPCDGIVGQGVELEAAHRSMQGAPSV